MKTRNVYLTGLALLFCSPLLLAHPGHDPIQSNFISGLLHPLTGLDHLAMLLGIGALGAWQTAKQRSQLYTGTLGILFAGAILGLLTGFESGIEVMILASMFLIAVALFFSARGLLPMLAALALVMFHGWAHGLEMPGGGVFTFMPGMLIMASVIMTAGYALGKTFQPKWLGAGSGAAALLITLLG
ncbi:HupE-UreJ family metal transporter [Nitrincola lacisaponensis]|uniref:HupE-UreJ family metal transporter n=1 Tax=Nitrincola lacisaponensis TaxID=267850 RepID=A0A063Y4Y1_9GAMM|nr:HupE/UreJ family protein [Nitrincola lacisaponensis]KDE40205.1 HupE-UreJ family metal transporter [Nitrincola lacisaponensis]